LAAVLAGVVVIAVASHQGDLPLLFSLFTSAIQSRHHGVGGEGLCPQSDVLYPARHAQLWRRLGRDFDDDAFTARAVSWLGGAVRVRCVFGYCSLLVVWGVAALTLALLC
jgi:hypothetical protein